MKRLRSLRVARILACLAGAVVVAGALSDPAPAALRPTGDIVERFGADPLTLQDAQGKHLWFASGPWEWDGQGTTLSSKGSGMGSLVWLPGGHFTGSLRLRYRLGGDEARARLLFAVDPATGAYRWVEVAAGAPGRVTVGQTGSIRGSAPGVIQVWRTPVAVGAWQELSLAIAGNKGVTVALDGRNLFTAGSAPLASGLVGFGWAGGPVIFDEFAFTANPDGEPCRECHAGQPDQPLAANVYTYWDGRWWDQNKGGTPNVQQGGHGDPGGKPALGCTGANGCHDMTQPTPKAHRNGVREGRAHQSVNSYHLRSGFIVARAENPWDAQITFDAYCTTACHPAASVPAFRHSPDADPAAGAVQLGTLNASGYPFTRADGETLAVPVDSDITRRATPAEPDFAPCISCHDPHGSGSRKVEKNLYKSNLMLRADYTGDLCRFCHL